MQNSHRFSSAGSQTYCLCRVARRATGPTSWFRTLNPRADQPRYDHSRDQGQECAHGNHTKNGAGPEIKRRDLAGDEAVAHKEVGHDPVDHAGRKSWREVALADGPEQVQRNSVKGKPEGP